MNTTENNILLAEFLGKHIKEGKNYHEFFAINSKLYSTDELKFHNDWNWLMQVVEKIESIGFWVEILGGVHNVCQIGTTNEENSFIYLDDEVKIEAVYNACIKFVKWYNESLIQK